LNDMAEHGLPRKITEIRTTPLVLEVDKCSATSMESSRRELSNDMVELRPALKNNHNTYYPCFKFHIQNMYRITRNEYLILLCGLSSSVES